ncbi:MAG TPA: PEP/pyruvate-binding domain-containing protein [Pyrinomonadaceae bacterium]|jgi:hypothetical protein
MDIEWAKDGVTSELFVVQARPETVHSLKPRTASAEVYRLKGAHALPLVSAALAPTAASSWPKRRASQSARTSRRSRSHALRALKHDAIRGAGVLVVAKDEE